MCDLQKEVNNFTKSVSDTASHVGQVISSSPIAQVAITAGGAMLGIPPQITAGLLTANSVGQGQSIGQAALTGGLSYLGGTGINNYAATGSMFGTGSGAVASATAAEKAAAADLISQGYSSSAAWEAVNAGATGAASTVGAGTGAAAGGLSGLLSGSNGQLLQTGLGLAGSYLNGQAATDAAATQAQAQIRAAQIAADAAKFRPVGVTTNFGASQFGYDANGNLATAGYMLSPQLQAQQNKIMGASDGLLNQYTGAQAATAPMADAAQRAMTLGNQYLATDPQAQAQKYYNDQQAILAPGRAQDMAALQAQMQAQGRGGFAIGGGVGGQGAANPQLQALLNAQMQQNTQLSANATQGGMDYAKFGLGTVGSGGDLLSSMYGVQGAAASPYTAALGTANTIEGMGQQAMNLGTSIGAKSSTGAAQAGMLTANGINNAAQTMAPANAYSPWGSLLTGGANALQQYKFGV